MRKQTTPKVDGWKFVYLYLSPEVIGEADFAGWRLHVNSPEELRQLPFPPAIRAMQRKALQKSRYGIAIDSVGGVVAIRKKGQIIEEKTDTLSGMGYVN